MGTSNKIKIFLSVFIALFLFFSFNFCLAAGNLKDAFDTNAGKPLNTTVSTAGYGTSATAEGIIGLIITTALTFVGVIFLALTLYGGYIWMIARGNEQEVERAKNIIINSIIGLVVVIAAYAISWYVINALGNAALKSSTGQANQSQTQEESDNEETNNPNLPWNNE